MSNENHQNIYGRMKRYLMQSALHIVAFSSMALVRGAILKPSSLHTPLILFVSLMSLIFLISLHINNFNRALSIHAFNKASSTNLPPEKNQRLHLFNHLKSILMFSSNIGLALFTVAYALYAPTGAYALATGLAIYHCLHSIRDYLNDKNALDFINRYFRITLDYQQDRKIMTHSISSNDPSELHMVALNINDDIKKKYQLTCQIDQIDNDKIESIMGINSNQIMYQPVHITSKTNHAEQYWVDYNSLIGNNNIHTLQEDFFITHEHNAITQNKMNQIRSIIVDTSNKLSQLKTLQSKLRALCYQETVQTYRQAITTTNEETEKPTHNSGTPSDAETNYGDALLSQMQQLQEQLITECQKHDLPTTTESNTPRNPIEDNETQEPAHCSITYQAASIPLIVNLLDQESNQEVSFHCDAMNLLNWLDSDPNDAEQKSDMSCSMDQQELKAVLQNKENPIPLICTHQIRDIQDRMSPGEASNPIALLLKHHQQDSISTLEALLTSQYIQCRLHDRDLLTTLSSNERRYFSLAEYLEEHQLHDHYAMIVTKCYSEDTSMGAKKPDYTFNDSNDAALLNKRWPMHGILMAAHTTIITVKLDIQEMQNQMERAKQVIRYVLKPKMEAIKKNLEPNETYYIRSDYGFALMPGNEITPEKILSYNMFGDRTTISTNPLDREPFTTGVHLNTRSNDARTPLPQNFAVRELFPGSP